jgi:PAS domain S-box-containing protein
MTVPTVSPTGREVFFDKEEIIVSKTDLKGIVTYANDVFLRIAGYEEEEALGQSHNFIRHPAMPKCVFQLLWDTIQAGEEIFAYVVNMAKNGDHYWVLAHVTPTFGPTGEIVGYHSSRRVPERSAVEAMTGIYAELLEVEAGYSNMKEGIQAATTALLDKLAGLDITYPEFVFSLQGASA